MISSKVSGYSGMFQTHHICHIYIQLSFPFPISIASVVYFHGSRVLLLTVWLTTSSSLIREGGKRLLQYFYYNYNYRDHSHYLTFLFETNKCPFSDYLILKEIHLISLRNCAMSLSRKHIDSPHMKKPYTELVNGQQNAI